MDVVKLTQELVKRQSITPQECGIYTLIKSILQDFTAIECEENGVKNLFLYKDFSGDSSGGDYRNCGDSADFDEIQDSSDFKKSTDSSDLKASNDSNDSTLFSDFEKSSDSKKPHICFAGHIDVVPAGEGWSVEPFGGEIKDSVLYGRGVQDMKGGVAAFVTALKEIKHFSGILSLLLTSDEEGDGIYGTKIMLEVLKKQNLLPDFAIVAEPTCRKVLGDSIKVGRRGSINGILRIFGTQGHAAYPQKCLNPIDLIAPILAEISSKDLDSGNESFAPSKVIITDIRAGMEATNVTPSELKLMFNVRNSPLTDKDSIESYIKSLLKKAKIQRYELSFSQSSFPFLCDSATLLKSLTFAISSVTNITPQANTEGGTSDARYFSAFGVEVVEFGLINDRIHAIDECVKVRDLELLRDIFIAFLQNFKRFL